MDAKTAALAVIKSQVKTDRRCSTETSAAGFVPHGRTDVCRKDAVEKRRCTEENR
jgi:hypothetical protein